MRGGPSGDLYIFVHVRGMPIFEREGTTLFAACRSASPPRRSAADRGPGPRRQKHEIKIPVGIQSGKQLRQRGAGMPGMNGRGYGDMVIQVEVETPTKLTAKQREMLEEFRDTETGEECPNSRASSRRSRTRSGAEAVCRQFITRGKAGECPASSFCWPRRKKRDLVNIRRVQAGMDRES